MQNVWLAHQSHQHKHTHTLAAFDLFDEPNTNNKNNNLNVFVR